MKTLQRVRLDDPSSIEMANRDSDRTTGGASMPSTTMLIREKKNVGAPIDFPTRADSGNNRRRIETGWNIRNMFTHRRNKFIPSRVRPVSRIEKPSQDISTSRALLTSLEASRLLQVSPRTITRLIASCAIQHRRVRGQIRFTQGDIDDYIERCKITVHDPFSPESFGRRLTR